VSALARIRSADPPQMIYIVDDDEAVRDSLRLLLVAMGFSVADFACGATFFERSAPDQGKCLILDVNLPGSSGLEVLARLREEGSALPVVMVSGGADAAMKRRAIELGAAAFLDKPVAFDLLRSTLARALAGRAGAAAL
jgi:two-component system response regulator FixJ